MNSSSSSQLELLATASPEDDQRSTVLLGLAVSQETFLRFLGNGWIHPAYGDCLTLGTRAACLYASEVEEPVVMWFDSSKLPRTTVEVWRDGDWHEGSSASCGADDEFVAWAGPLPLFAAHHFDVGNEELRLKMLALAGGFADTEVPEQPIGVASIRVVEAPASAPRLSFSWRPPENWDSLRGAAAMAAYAVPAIDPWVELLCQWVRTGAADPELVERLNAPWFAAPVWSRSPDAWGRFPALWRAALEEFSDPGVLDSWRPKMHLAGICDRARELGEVPDRIERFQKGASGLLNDAGTITQLGTLDDQLALALQLLLLRPSPDRFATWREDWRAIPPASWWSGMILSGYLQGYRAMPRELRGMLEARKLLDLRTWEFGARAGAGPWAQMTSKPVDWLAVDETFHLKVDSQLWASHHVGTRGRWYQSDFDNPMVRELALRVAYEACPQSVTSVLALVDTSLPFSGPGTLKVELKKHELTVKGRVNLQVGRDIKLEERLDVERFQDWLATASINIRLPKPIRVREEPPAPMAVFATFKPEVLEKPKASSKKTPATDKTKRISAVHATDAPPAGLSLVLDFISAPEEKAVLEAIDDSAWDTSMKRRVQHYGWRYDYKSRGVHPEDYLGPLPAWAQALAQRLFERGYFPEMPDQVIVNNYDGPQGISKHVDCKECFRGPIATISLLETWDMVFTRTLKGENLKFVQPLTQRSVAVLDGEARNLWAHEIPVRQTEHKKPRKRRVSVTFRKVAADAPTLLR
jgi:alkylated DNA repair dioxygenase AlkB